MTKDEALKLALEALEEAADAIDSWGSYASGYFQVKHDLESDISKAKSAITAIKEALAQPEQEPVAWMCADESLINKGYARFSHVCMGDWKIPVYTNPPQRKPLTDEEVQYALESAFLGSDEKRNWQDDLRVARAIEAAHGIKGEA